MCGQEIIPTESQKDPGFIITSNVFWQGNSTHRVQNATCAFFQIKRNLSAISSTSNKMNRYTNYIISRGDVLLTGMVTKPNQHVQI